MLNNLNLDFYDADSVKTGDTKVVEGGIIVNDVINFKTIQLAENAYDSSIDISDMYAVIKHMNSMQTLDGVQYHSADNNDDGEIDISDMYGVIKHMNGMKTLDTFDLVDAAGNRVEQLTPDTIATNTEYKLIANGDVNLSGSFDDAYLFTASEL